MNVVGSLHVAIDASFLTVCKSEERFYHTLSVGKDNIIIIVIVIVHNSFMFRLCGCCHWLWIFRTHLFTNTYNEHTMPRSSLCHDGDDDGTGETMNHILDANTLCVGMYEMYNVLNFIRQKFSSFP